MEPDKEPPKEAPKQDDERSDEYRKFERLASKLFQVPKDEAKTAKRAKNRPKP